MGDLRRCLLDQNIIRKGDVLEEAPRAERRIPDRDGVQDILREDMLEVMK